MATAPRSSCRALRPCPRRAAAEAQAAAPARRPPGREAGGACRPPVLDRELFFGNPEIAGAQLSPDGQYVAFLKPWKDTRNIYVKKTERALREGAAAHDRDEAADPELLLDARQQAASST